MKIVSTNYCKTEAFAAPELWLQHIAFYTGILEELARHHQVESLERINYKGRLHKNGVTYHFISQRKRIVRFPFNMHRLVRRLKPDVVLVNGFIFPLQVIQLRLFVGKKTKIFLIHRAEKPFCARRKWLHLLCEKWVDVFLFASAEFAEQWVNAGLIGSRQKTREIIQATSSFTPGKKTTSKQNLFIKGDPVCLWVGRLDANKDPLT
ncbi:MAG TPA: hypothetical protein VFL47_03220, partial [Flavisolibacter sp.]|nr:hypothetical protein [Flavisolibacter sp.]